MGTLSGMASSFTDGMSFTYSGENNWMDRLDPISPAIAILENDSPSYYSCIAYNQGSYSTIGASHEFGGLDEGSNARAELMARYLQFFGIPILCEWVGNTNDWHGGANWSNGIVPDASTDVIIPYDPGNPYPIQFTGGDADCRRLFIEPGANLNVPTGVTVTIHQ
jgi:hypothetical protein